MPKKQKFLQINDQYRITGDEHNLILEKKRNTQKAGWYVIGFHARTEDVFKSLCEHLIRDNLDDLKLAIEKINEIRQIIKEFKKL